MFKKLTFLTLLTTPAIAANTPLTITPTELENGTAYLSWDEDLNPLTSWELTFTLSLIENPTGSVFETRKGTYSSNAYLNVYLSEEKVLLYYKTKQNDVGTTLLSCDRTFTDSCTITLSFVSQKENNDTINQGVLTLQINDTIKAAKTITEETYLNTAILNNNSPSNDGPYNYIIAHNGNTKFSNITLYRLDDKIIPEPATATLSVVGLLSLLSRRRRKQTTTLFK